MVGTTLGQTDTGCINEDTAFLSLHLLQILSLLRRIGLSVEKPLPGDPGAITVKKITPVVASDRPPCHTMTVKVYVGTLEFDQQSVGSTTPTAPPGHRRRPQPRQLSSRFRFCPVARTSASIFTFTSSRRRKRSMPCHALPSPN